MKRYRNSSHSVTFGIPTPTRFVVFAPIKGQYLQSYSFMYDISDLTPITRTLNYSDFGYWNYRQIIDGRVVEDTKNATYFSIVDGSRQLYLDAIARCYAGDPAFSCLAFHFFDAYGNLITVLPATVSKQRNGDMVELHIKYDGTPAVDLSRTSYIEVVGSLDGRAFNFLRFSPIGSFNGSLGSRVVVDVWTNAQLIGGWTYTKGNEIPYFIGLPFDMYMQLPFTTLYIALRDDDNKNIIEFYPTRIVYDGSSVIADYNGKLGVALKDVNTYSWALVAQDRDGNLYQIGSGDQFSMDASETTNVYVKFLIAKG